MKLTRRGLIKAGALNTVPWVGFKMMDGEAGPSPPKKDRAVIWAVFLGGNCQSTYGLEQNERVKRHARNAGWEVLDSFHAVNHSSKFLARMETSLAFARDQEMKLLRGDGAKIFGDNELYPNSLWIEVA